MSTAEAIREHSKVIREIQSDMRIQRMKKITNTGETLKFHEHCFDLHIIKMSQFFRSEKKGVRRHSTSRNSRIAIPWPPREISPGCTEKMGREEHTEGRKKIASNIKPKIFHVIQSELLHHKVLSWRATYKSNTEKLIQLQHR